MQEQDDIEEIDFNTITIFTDGSVFPNPGPGGWAWCGMFREFTAEASGHLPSATNNVAELTAILMALKAVHKDEHPILIITDSSYAHKCLTVWPKLWERNDWQDSVGSNVANRELIQEILRIMRGRSVKIRWMKGHQTANTFWAQHNAHADFLAGKARKNA